MARQESLTPVPLRPPHTPIERRLDEKRGQIVEQVRPALISDHGLNLPGLMVAQSVEAVTRDPSTTDEASPVPGYL